MSTYRAYRIDRRHHIVNGQWLEAEDDAEAKHQAEELCEQGAPIIEVWQAARLVEQIDCEESH
jgi:hypothetical protein